MKVIFWIVLAAALIFAGFFAVSFSLLRANMRPGKAPDLSQAKKIKGRWAAYAYPLARGVRRLRDLPWEDVFIRSREGLRLHGRVYRQGHGPVVLMAHGFHSSGENDFAGIADYYIDRGFTLLLIDQRTHGQSEGRYISFAVKERWDVRLWANWAAENLGGSLWLHGVSMGAASCLMAAALGLPENVRGVVVDSAFTSPKAVLAHQFSRQYPLPRFPFVAVGTLAGLLVIGKDFAFNSTERAAAAAASTPMLFVYGGEDITLAPDSTPRLLAARGNKDPFLFVPRGRHAMCWLAAPKSYAAALDSFLAETASPEQQRFFAETRKKP